MTENITDSSDDIGSFMFDTKVGRLCKFGLLIALQIPSVGCSLLIFHSFIRTAEIRAKVHLHIIFGLLLCSCLIACTELPLTLVYLRFGQLNPPTSSLCLLWIFLNYWLFPASCWIMAVASIQRYLLIYHRHLINTPLKHHIPMVSPPIFLFIWYIILIFFYPCEQQFDYAQPWCWGSCYLYQTIIATVDYMISSLIPVVLTTILNILLVVRVVYQKYKMRRGRIWQRTRKLTLQLLSISFLFLTLYLPLIIFGLIRLWLDSFFLFYFMMAFYNYSTYLVPLLMPFVCLISLPEVIEHWKLYYSNIRVEPVEGHHFPMHTISQRQPKSHTLRY